jgi:hypothetical protein
LPSSQALLECKGRAALDALDELKLGLLSGIIEPASLRRLQLLAGDLNGGTDDPRLDVVLAEIELRVGGGSGQGRGPVARYLHRNGSLCANPGRASIRPLFSHLGEISDIARPLDRDYKRAARGELAWV